MDEMVKGVDLARDIPDLDGKPIPLADGGTAEPNLTLRRVLRNALVAPEQGASWAKVADRYALQMDLRDVDHYEFTEQQKVDLKECLARIYNPLVIGAVCLMLDGKL